MNRLQDEKSPYLLQHRGNPVNWFPWGEDAFALARASNKPIFLSIGYSTCYWCHVMERDSFEHQDVADVLNANYISVKVDREERPDVDQIYMEAVVALTGHGGWPMSVFLTPDLKPFFGGTFFPHDTFIEVLEKVAKYWREKGDDLVISADRISNAISADLARTSNEPLDESYLSAAFEWYSENFDSQNGGFGGAPKFPPSQAIRLLLRLHRRSERKDCLAIATETLRGMARGGIFDQLGGGFHRYSTDAEWLVPHFEKMLYDNALLAEAYAEAYQVTGDPTFRAVAEETLDYVLRDLREPSGAIHSAEDAGEVAKEGEYYVWTKDELSQLLTSEEQSLFYVAYGVSDRGNFEGGTTILSLQSPYEWDAKKDFVLQRATKKLLAARNARVRPHRDDKILTAWNALAITALARAASIFDRSDYLDAAKSAASFVLKELVRDGRVLRRYRAGEAKFDGTLEDYAYLIRALLDLYEATSDPSYFNRAVDIQSIQDQLFLDERRGAYFFAMASPDLIHRRCDFVDSATPSPNGIAAQNLFRLFHLTGNELYRNAADRIVTAALGQVSRYPSAFASILIAMNMRFDVATELCVVTRDAEELERALRPIRAAFLPTTVVAASHSASETPPLLTGKTPPPSGALFYVCESQTCKAPVTSAKEALSILSVARPLVLGGAI
ncbi:MAG: thioredoxin domain-containing protein [Deltaproteobacteria bacterium]|nr:thioredoxin domain-containing protein [Deltaproteobacteria bacterium]